MASVIACLWVSVSRMLGQAKLSRLIPQACDDSKGHLRGFTLGQFECEQCVHGVSLKIGKAHSKTLVRRATWNTGTSGVRACLIRMSSLRSTKAMTSAPSIL